MRVAQPPREHQLHLRVDVLGVRLDREASGFIENDDARIDLLALEVRRDQPHHGTQGDDSNNAVKGGKERRHLIADLALVAMRDPWRGSLTFGPKLLRTEQLRPGQRGDDPSGQHNAVTGNRHDRDPLALLGRCAVFAGSLRPPGAQGRDQAGHGLRSGVTGLRQG